MYARQNIYVKAYLESIPGAWEMSSGEPFEMGQLFKALADRTRLRLINLIGGDEACVCFFVELIGTNQPNASRQPAYSRRAGLVSVRREGKWMHHRLTEPKDERAARVFAEVRQWLSEDREMQRDRERLVKVCGAPQPPVSVRGAPRPSQASVAISCRN
ncbi:MAG: ArsR/SmtB family transcription factor [Pyrinomonadaceae bacterium]